MKIKVSDIKSESASTVESSLEAMHIDDKNPYNNCVKSVENSTCYVCTCILDQNP